MSDDIAALEAEVERARLVFNDAKDRLERAREKACGVVIGQLVRYKGDRYRVMEIDASWKGKPWLVGNKQRADGSYGTGRRNLYGDWEVV